MALEMAESTFAWLSVSVKRGATTLISRRIVKAGWDYSATLVSFPSVCYFCGIEEECFVEDEEIEKLRCLCSCETDMFSV